MTHRLIIIIATLLFPFTISAQNDNNLVQRYTSEYEKGHFEETEKIIKENLQTLKGKTLIGAYRILALSCIFTDRPEEAEAHVGELLRLDPFYSAYNDNPRFTDMIERLKGGKALTITTASQQAEKLGEAPVPVTLITEDMIRNSGARTLAELLDLFVPGVNLLEGEETNFSMRGLASYSQENVLIMRNGVRLNSYATNSASPDYRISLANIKQIEVLRGAASSLYGNVALTAVVNIITKSGEDINGLRLSAGAGNGNTYKADMLFGKRMLDTEVVVWGSVFTSHGYRHNITTSNTQDNYGLLNKDGYIYVNGFRNMPAYDIGMTIDWKHLNVNMNQSYGKRTYAYCNLHFPATYDHDRYATFNSFSPGRGVRSTNFNLRYTNEWKNLSLTVDVYGNHEETTLYNIFGDVMLSPDYISEAIYTPNPELFRDSLDMSEGIYQTQNWKNYNLGSTVKALYSYDLGALGKGSLLGGVQYDYFNLYYNDFSFGRNYNTIVTTVVNDDEELLSNHHETNISAFLQLKHYILPTLIFNGGLRYDHKYRYVGNNNKVLSPRVALIWNPTATSSYRLSFARSFVDAPFFYRASRKIYFGNSDLQAEFLSNLQLSASFTFPALHLSYDANVFYNNAQDVIVLGDIEYENSGNLKSVGMEHILSYKNRGWALQGSLFVQRILKVEETNGSEHSVYGIPNVTARLNASKEIDKRLTLLANLSFSSSSKAYIPFYVLMSGEPMSEEGMHVKLPSRLIADFGARYTISNLEFDLKLKNVFNTKYRLGGDRVPVLQEGFMAVGSLTWNI